MRSNSFIRIPRSLYASEAWRNATHEQRSIFIDLCFRMAFTDIEIEVFGRKVTLHPGQMIMSQCDMAKEWGMSRQQVRTVIKQLADHGFISTNTSANGYGRYTILTVNELVKDTHQCKSNKGNQYLKEGMFKQEGNLPLKSSPKGEVLADSSDVSSACTTSSRPSSLTKQICAERKALEDQWRTWVMDEADVSAHRFLPFLPYNAANMCNDMKAMALIHTSPSIPCVKDVSLAHMKEYFEFYVFDTLYKSGLRTKMRPDALRQLAHTLRLRSHAINVGEVMLFFYLLLNPDRRIGNHEWHGTFDAVKVLKAFSEYMIHLQQV